MNLTRRTPEAQEAYFQGYRAAEAAAMREAKRLVDEQARDEGLWFQAQTCAEAYVQTALRKLHAAVEGDKSMIFPAVAVNPGKRRDNDG
jgi:hypothetical protein